MKAVAGSCEETQPCRPQNEVGTQQFGFITHRSVSSRDPWEIVEDATARLYQPRALGHCYFPNPLDNDFVTVRGAAGQSEKAHFLKPLKYTLGKQGRIHKFFYMLNSPKPLLGWDL